MCRDLWQFQFFLTCSAKLILPINGETWSSPAPVDSQQIKTKFAHHAGPQLLRPNMPMNLFHFRTIGRGRFGKNNTGISCFKNAVICSRIFDCESYRTTLNKQVPTFANFGKHRPFSVFGQPKKKTRAPGPKTATSNHEI